MSETSRVAGIDLCSRLAAFAVILVHSEDETWGVPISDRAIQFRYLFYSAVPIFLLSFLATVSILLYQLLIVSKNDFNLGDYDAFAQLFPVALGGNIFAQAWRCILVNLAWLIRCLPYLAIALLLQAILRQDIQWLYQPVNVTAIFLVFLLVDILGAKYLPNAVSELLIAYSLLLFGIAVSQYIPDSNLITNLGLCSFGIYLIHPLVKSIVEILLAKTLPQVTQSVSITSMLIYAISSFLFSWLAIALMQKNKLIAQYI
jgi:peptidoglycan/LPS O-acetylase OafA/YrhL